MKTPKSPIAAALACALALSLVPATFAGGDKAKSHDFSMMDTDGNGQISRAEHAAGAKKMFTEADANQDGFVTAQEMTASMAKHAQKSAGAKVAQGDKTTHSDKAMKYDAMVAEVISMCDSNGDGKLTAAEHDSGSEKMFARADRNSDGSLSLEECEMAHKDMKKST